MRIELSPHRGVRRWLHVEAFCFGVRVYKELSTSKVTVFRPVFRIGWPR